MAAPPSIYLLDSGSNAWLVGVDNLGAPELTPTASPTVPPVTAVLLRDTKVGSQFWTLGATLDGAFTWNSTTTASSQTQLICQALNGGFWGLQIAAGLFETVPATACLAAMVGTLYLPGGPNGIYTQPGGPNTPVFPAQQNGPWPNYPVPGQFFIEMSGLWMVGCGHSVDQPEIYRDFDACTGLSAAVIACPICSYIQYLLEPYEVIYDPLSHPTVII